jgi:hypothetical protein
LDKNVINFFWKIDIDVIERGSNLFNQLVVAVLRNPSKNPCFSVEERLEPAVVLLAIGDTRADDGDMVALA